MSSLAKEKTTLQLKDRNMNNEVHNIRFVLKLFLKLKQLKK